MSVHRGFLILLISFTCSLGALNPDSYLVKGVNTLAYQGECHWRADTSSSLQKHIFPPEFLEFISDGLELFSLGSSNSSIQKISSVLVAVVRFIDVLLGSYPKMRGPALRVPVLVEYDASDPCFRGKNGFDWCAVDPNDPRFTDKRGDGPGGSDDYSPFNFWHNPFDDDAKTGLIEPNPWLASSDIAALWLNQLHKLQSLRHQKTRFSEADSLAKYNKDLRMKDHKDSYIAELKVQLFFSFLLFVVRLAYVKTFKGRVPRFTRYHALHGLHHALSLYRRYRFNSFQSDYLGKAKAAVAAASA